MMKNRVWKHLASLMLAIAMVFAVSSSEVLAAETDEVNDVSIQPVANDGAVSPMWEGDIVKSKTFTGQSTDFSVTTTEGNWAANFLVKVTGNPNALWTVSMTGPTIAVNNYLPVMTNGNSGYIRILNLAYAAPATYKFHIFTTDAVSGSTTLSVKITD